MKYFTFLDLEVERLSEMAAKYGSLCNGLKKQLDEEVVSVQFATGGDIMHRGYYCPSPVQDIVVGGCKRGKLLKQPNANGKFNYKYGFDSNGKMITVEHFSLKPDEIIVRQDQVEIGIEFKEIYGIFAITECVYSGSQIMSYAYALYDPFEKYVIETKKELYSYSAEGLEKADFLSVVGSKSLFGHQQYTFQHDEDGYLSCYTYDEIVKGAVKPSIWNGHVFDIKVKRKV